MIYMSGVFRSSSSIGLDEPVEAKVFWEQASHPPMSETGDTAKQADTLLYQKSGNASVPGPPRLPHRAENRGQERKRERERVRVRWGRPMED